MSQLDIFGQVVESIEPEPTPAEQPKVSQPHLFEPQMEGQLELTPTATATPIRLATTSAIDP